MAEWRERRRRRRWFDIFDDIDRFFQGMMREAFESTPPTKVKRLTPFVYGYSVTIGPDGRPVIKEFGNVRRGGQGPLLSKVREPVADIIEQEDKVIVIAELPGVSKEDIDLRTTERRLSIRVDMPSHKYAKDIDLPVPVEPSTAKANCRNGVLEVRLAKAK